MDTHESLETRVSIGFAAGWHQLNRTLLNGYLVLRTIPKTRSDADMRAAQELSKKIKIYPLAKAGSPPEQRFVDMLGKPWNALPTFDQSYYSSIARMVNEEPVQSKDLAAMGALLSLGIEKGKEFKPDAATQARLNTAAREASAWLMSKAVDSGQQFWPERKWLVPVDPIGPKTEFSWQTPDYLAVEARGVLFFYAFGPPKQLGGSSFYLSTYHDSRGQRFSGENSYRLRVPANVPVRDFWSVTAYDAATSAPIREMSRAALGSLDPVKVNADGSVDLYFGPVPPDGQQSNWIPTVRGRSWFQWFRFFGTEKTLFEKTWKLPDVELLTQ